MKPSSNVKLYSLGKPGNMSFLIELDDTQLTIPRDIRKLNSLILNNQLDPLRLVELFSKVPDEHCGLSQEESGVRISVRKVVHAA